VIAAAILIPFGGCGGGGTTGGDKPGELDGGGAHINSDAEAGSTNGLEPDERQGIIPPPVKLTDLEAAAEKAGCYLMLRLKDEGHEHVPPESPTPEYETDPPTSGSSVESPYQQADGAYLEMPAPIDFVHSLEYGRLEIQYAPDLPEKVQQKLKGVYDTMYGATLLFPNSEMNFAVAATTWTNDLACTGWEKTSTLDVIRDFGRATWGKYGGEPVDALPFTGPTPAEPEEPEPPKEAAKAK
jgi:hypothetical protein